MQQEKLGEALPPVRAPHLSTQELRLLEQAFRARQEKTARPDHRLSRLRLCVIFLLVRHAALRLGEALALDDEKDLDLATGVVHVRGSNNRGSNNRGSNNRDVPLPRQLLPELRRLFASPLSLSSRGSLTRLDPGYVRRNFYARARECGLPPDLASPRALRQARAAELIAGGMPLPAVQKFLGQPSLESTGELLAYSEADIRSITKDYLRRETKMKTSARNIFPGRVSRIRQSGFMAEVGVTSFTGLELTAVITEESLENLQLAVGKTVIATVKAPWVVLSRGTATKASARNRFSGTVARVKRSDLICEVEVELPEGSGVCALITTESADSLGFVPGEAATVLFKALAVILTLP